MPKYSLTVVDTPIAKPRARTVSHGGKVHSYTPSHGLHSEWEIKQAFLAGEFPCLLGAISLAVRVFLPMPNNISKRRAPLAKPTKRPDWDNFAKTVCDALTGLAWKNDSQIVAAWVVKQYARTDGHHPGPPRWDIEWTELPDGS